jgi:transposase
MGKPTRFVGLDVHAETIAVAIAEGREEVRSLGTIPNEADAIRRLVKKLGGPEGLRVCYEAGPCGYVLYWQLAGLGVACEVVAPTLVPVRPGDRVKTDRRDAAKLARSYRAGELTAVWVPDAEHEALRDLVRAREAAKADQLRARHRVQKFLLRQGRRWCQGKRAWTQAHALWLNAQRFDQPARQAAFLDYLQEVRHARERVEDLERAIDEAIQHVPAPMKALIAGLQALRGIGRLSATTIVAEVGPLSRFSHPRQLMGYSGAVPSEHSSGSKTSRGAITKAGNAHLRRVLVEAAWAYQHRPSVYGELSRRQQGLSPEIKAIAWKAQNRLHSRYQRLWARGKPKQQVMTAVARELAGFIWSIGHAVHENTL